MAHGPKTTPKQLQDLACDTTMLLSEFLDDIYVVERSICPAALDDLRVTARIFSKFIQRRARISDLTPANVNRWLAHLQATRSRAYTFYSRAKIRAIWSLARELDLVPPIRIRSVPKYRPQPKAWTREEVLRLIATADKVRDHGRWKNRSWFWVTAISFAWETGLRWKDQMRVQRSHIPKSLVWDVEQNKSGKLVRVGISPQTLAAIDSNQCGPGLIWGNKLTYNAFRTSFARIVKRSGVEYGSWKRLRKSCGNWVDQNGGHGWEALGNEQRTWEKHYRDRRFDTRDIIRPPGLIEAIAEPKQRKAKS